MTDEAQSSSLWSGNAQPDSMRALASKPRPPFVHSVPTVNGECFRLVSLVALVFGVQEHSACGAEQIRAVGFMGCLM